MLRYVAHKKSIDSSRPSAETVFAVSLIGPSKALLWTYMVVANLSYRLQVSSSHLSLRVKTRRVRKAFDLPLRSADFPYRGNFYD